MPSEAGDMKVLGNFRILIDQVSSDSNYNPANPALTATALEALHAAAQAAVENVAAKLAPHRIATGDRATAFDAMIALVIRSRNMLKALGASKRELEDADTPLRKILGRRKSSTVKEAKPATDKPETPQNEAAATHSASQLSFDNRLGNLGAYLEMLSNVASYNPNEADLKIASLKTMAANLRAKNNAVSATFAPLSQARGHRDQVLYTNADSLVDTALLVKAYIKGALGTSSQLHKQIKGLKFGRSQK